LKAWLGKGIQESGKEHLLDGAAMEDDVEQRDEVHECEHGRDHVETVGKCFPPRRNAHQHERDAQLDRNDG
jgi:hypothetical protein